MSCSEFITAITVNFKTPDLVQTAVESFKSFYPDATHILIDNGGCLESLSVCRELTQKYDNILLVANSKNLTHGPALNQGLSLVETPYAFLLDSDTETQKGEFLELMLERFRQVWDLFAVGWLRYVDSNSGVGLPNQGEKRGLPYIHPYACLLSVEKFRRLEPFTRSGAPATKLMWSAKREGLKVEGFPVSDYIWHKVAGTRGLFRGNCLPGTKDRPGTWSKRRI